MIDDPREEHEEELERRDRIGEKAPALHAAFGGAIEQLADPRDADGNRVLIEPKDGSHIPPEVRQQQLARYRRMIRATELPPASAPLRPQGLWQWPKPRKYTVRDQVAAAMAYLRERR